MLSFLKRVFRPATALLALFTLAACEDMPATTRAVDPNAPVLVALLVPLGSGNAVTDQLGQSLVNAARMAQGDVRGANIDLRVYETGGNAEMATSAATRAVAEGAQIIVGPLFSPATTAAASVARAAGINVLSFSNNPAIAGGNVFIMGTTFDTVADRLVSYSVGQGMNRFAVVNQDGLEGEAGRAAVSAAVTRNGGNIVTTASYSLNFQELSDRADQIAAQLKSSGANAVFFTDSPLQGLGFVTAQLSTASYRQGRDAQFMGLTRWDTSSDLLNAPSMEGGWFAVPDPDLSAQFDARYLTAYGTEPHNLSGLAYDAVAAIGAMIASARQSGAASAFAVDRITNPAGFAGVNGIFRFNFDGTNQRGLAIMQVGTGTASVISPAPRFFGASGS